MTTPPPNVRLLVEAKARLDAERRQLEADYAKVEQSHLHPDDRNAAHRLTFAEVDERSLDLRSRYAALANDMAPVLAAVEDLWDALLDLDDDARAAVLPSLTDDMFTGLGYDIR